MKFSLCMIVRDEEAVLARCLASVADEVDEICIVDTGSTDATREIAEQFGAKLVEMPWADDFSEARNASLALATGDWVLVLDADEEVNFANTREALTSFAEQYAGQEPAAGQIWIIDRDASAPRDSGRSLVTRFFPRAAAPLYVGRVHEQLTFDGQVPPSADTGVEVLHTGYGAGSMACKNKLARNARMLEESIAEDASDPHLHYQLGRTYLTAEDFEAALEAFTNAIELVEADAPWLAHLFESTGYTLRALDQSGEALKLLRQVSGAFRERADTCFLEALLAFDVGELEAAELGFQRCLALDSGAPPRGGPFSRLSSTVAPAFNLAVLREALGMPAEAREYYECALAFDPEHQPSQDGLARL